MVCFPVTIHLPTGRLKKPTLGNNGYYHVRLWAHNKSRLFNIHRLLGIHFIPNPQNKPQVNHKDGNKLNNSLDNLEWVTHKENAIHAYKNGLTPKPPGHKEKGTERYNSILNNGRVMCIRKLFKMNIYTQRQLGDLYGVSRSGIQQVTRRVTWKHI